MAIAPQRVSVGIRRHFTTAGVHPYDAVTWERRDARITNYRDGAVAFEQLNVEVPEGWSLNATNILAQKYFRGTPNTDEREWSLRQVADRVVDTITAWGIKDGYFVDEEETESFRSELKHLIIHQMAAFNSPVWFNIGVAGVPQQGSACFILAVDDTMDSILNWYTEEGIIFKGGSGAGVNLSRIRSSHELLKGGGTASGPVSFMRGADSSAGTIKSGGKTRRAAKMVILDSDHPDIEDFIWCKAIEERKARVLRDAGFDMDLDGKDSISLQYQNANNSVRVTDEFMEAVVDGRQWALTSRGDDQPVRWVAARDLFRQIAQAAWECADPGMQFDTTVNRWHTASNTGRINGSNPCSEYMHIDNSACNLASLNLMKFLHDDSSFDIEGFRSAVEVIFTAQEIIVGNADYPTEKIADNSRRFRQLGIGYANIGALLMAQGLAYDSDRGRAWAAAITALMTGHAYATSARTAARIGPFAGYHDNVEPMLNVLHMHRDAVSRIDEEAVPTDLLSAAQEAWDLAVELGEQHGVRNSQASVLAPTGTIGLLMDCDTTGVEPDLGLVKTKKLVGGGTMSIVNQTVPRALTRLGYSSDQVDEIIAYIDVHNSIVGAPHLARRAPVRVRVLDGGQHHPLPGPRADDGRRPAVHFRCHLQNRQPSRGGDRRGRRTTAHRRLEDGHQGRRHLPRQLQGGPAPFHHQNEQRGRCRRRCGTRRIRGRGPCPRAEPEDRRPRGSPGPRAVTDRGDGCRRSGARAPSPAPHVVHLRVSGGGLRRIRDGRGVRGRASGRGVHEGVQAGIDAGRNYGCVLHFGELGSAARCAAGHLCPQVHQHAIRAGRHHRRCRSAHRHQPGGLHLPAPGGRLPPTGRAGRARVLSTSERMQPTLPGVEETATQSSGVVDAIDPVVATVLDGSADDAGAPAAPVPLAVPDPAEPGGGTQFQPVSRAEPRDAPYCYQCGNAMQRAGSCYVCASCGTTSGCS